MDAVALIAGLAGTDASWHALSKTATDVQAEAVVVSEVRSRFTVDIMDIQEKHYAICCNQFEINRCLKHVVRYVIYLT